MIGPYCDPAVRSSLSLIVHAWDGPSKFPLAWFTFALASAVRRVSRLRPYDASAVGFARTRTAGRCPPLILTRPTPWSWEILCAIRVSANSSIFGSGTVVDVMANVRIGASAGFVLLYTGGTG